MRNLIVALAVTVALALAGPASARVIFPDGGRDKAVADRAAPSAPNRPGEPSEPDHDHGKGHGKGHDKGKGKGHAKGKGKGHNK